MKIILVNEQTDKKYEKTLVGKDTNWFYDLDEDLDIFFDNLEEEYNCTLDFTGGDGFISWTIYEIIDETLFPIILDKIFNFLKDPYLWLNTNKYNL